MQRVAQAENSIGNRIAVMMIVKKPAIQLLLAKGCLDLFKVHGKNKFSIKPALAFGTAGRTTERWAPHPLRS
jgi:hypothetical protein